MTLFYVDKEGNYIGGFDGAEPPEGAIGVPSAPVNSSQIWDGSAWGAIPAASATVLKSTVMGRLTKEQMASAWAMLMADPVSLGRWFAPDRPFVNCDDPDAVAFVEALGLDPAVILAP